MSKESDILEGMHYDILLKWIEGGRVDIVPEGMEVYIKQLDAVAGFHQQHLSESQIIKRLQISFGLSRYISKQRYLDALNYFYLDNDVAYENRMRMYLGKLDDFISLLAQTAKTPNDIKIAVATIKEASLIAEKIKPKEKVSEELFKKPNKLYTIELSDLGVHESVDRNKLGKMIDDMVALEESEKIRVKQDAGVETRVLFEHEQETKD